MKKKGNCGVGGGEGVGGEGGEVDVEVLGDSLLCNRRLCCLCCYCCLSGTAMEMEDRGHSPGSHLRPSVPSP